MFFFMVGAVTGSAREGMRQHIDMKLPLSNKFSCSALEDNPVGSKLFIRGVTGRGQIPKSDGRPKRNDQRSNSNLDQTPHLNQSQTRPMGHICRPIQPPVNHPWPCHSAVRHGSPRRVVSGNDTQSTKPGAAPSDPRFRRDARRTRPWRFARFRPAEGARPRWLRRQRVS